MDTIYTKFKDSHSYGPPEICVTSFGVYGNIKKSYTLPLASYSVYGQPVGHNKVFYGVKQGRGLWLPNPAHHGKVAASCTDVVDCQVGRYYYYIGRFHPSLSISGPLASTVANNESFTNFLSVPPMESMEWLKVDALANAKESAASIMTTLAELPETIDMLNVKGVKLGKTLNKLRPRPTVRMVGSWLKYASDAWLQYRYGIMPALMEIDTWRYLFQMKTNFEMNKPYRETTCDHPSASTTTWNFVRPSSVGCYVSGFEETSTSGLWSSTVYSKKSMSMFAQCGVDWSGIVKTGYELIPYSFLVDWFLDIGTWLNAALPSPYVTVVDQTLSYKMMRTYRCVVQKACLVQTPSEWYIETPAYSTYAQSQLVYQRNLGLPAMGYMPNYQWGLDRLHRALDSASLIYGRIDRKLTKR